MPELLHPLIVHVPLGLAILMPVLLLAMALLEYKGALGRPAWAMALLVQAMLVAASFAAMKTGELEEERVEKGVPEAALHQHEEAAEVFTWSAAGLLVLTVLPILPLGAGLRRTVPFILVGLSIVVLALALRTGKAGGALVYEHFAPSVRAGLELPAPLPLSATPALPPAGEREHDGD